jgi:thioredoxin-like negative regulator of GroEL
LPSSAWFFHTWDNTAKRFKRYQEALAVDAKQDDVRLNLGIAYFKIENFSSALAELVKVVANQPTNYQADYCLEFVITNSIKLNEASTELETVYSAQPDNIAAAYALGNTYIGLQQMDKAETAHQ